MLGFLAKKLTRFLTRFLARFLARVFWIRKYSVQVYWDGEMQFYRSTGTKKNTVLQFYRDGEKRDKSCIKNPILLTIPYIKNLTVVVLSHREASGTRKKRGLDNSENPSPRVFVCFYRGVNFLGGKNAARPPLRRFFPLKKLPPGKNKRKHRGLGFSEFSSPLFF